MMPFSKPAVVIDNGSFTCKAGFACDNHPLAIVRTVVGRPKDRVGQYGKGHHEVYVGDAAVSMVENYELQLPVVCGRVVDWDNMERVWHHLYYKELKVAPEERAVISACVATTTFSEKVKCCEVFFETLNAPAMCIQTQSVLCLYASGFTTGISVDLGYEMTEVVPVYEGGLINYACMDTHISGQDINEYIRDNLGKRGIYLGENGNEIVEGIKKQAMYITPRDECGRMVKYTLPSGEVIDISEELYGASELLFNPQSIMGPGSKYLSVQDAVITAARKCDTELYPDLLGAVVPNGGVTAMPGFMDRFTKELETAADVKVNVVVSPEAYCLAWFGAAVYAGMADLSDVCVHKRQFQEYGEKIIRKKFV